MEEQLRDLDVVITFGICLTVLAKYMWKRRREILVTLEKHDDGRTR